MNIISIPSPHYTGFVILRIQPLYLPQSVQCLCEDFEACRIGPHWLAGPTQISGKHYADPVALNSGMCLDQAVIEESERRRYLCLDIHVSSNHYEMLSFYAAQMAEGSCRQLHFPYIRLILEKTGYLPKDIFISYDMPLTHSDRITHNRATCW